MRLFWWLLGQLPWKEHPLCLLRPWYMSECPGLEYCWPTTPEAVTWVRSISISFWKTPLRNQARYWFWKSNINCVENQNDTPKQKYTLIKLWMNCLNVFWKYIFIFPSTILKQQRTFKGLLWWRAKWLETDSSSPNVDRWARICS